jgi:hypothetical protein
MLGVVVEALDRDVVVGAAKVGERVPVERVRARGVGLGRRNERGCRAHGKYSADYCAEKLMHCSSLRKSS